MSSRVNAPKSTSVPAVVRVAATGSCFERPGMSNGAH